MFLVVIVLNAPMMRPRGLVGREVVGHDAIDVEADVGGLLFDLLAGGFDDLAKLV